MQKYGTETRLLNNQVYTVTLKVKDQVETSTFTSAYDPLFSTVRLIRGDYRTLFENYTNDEINRLIHDNSKLALEIANPQIEEGDVTPYYVKQYVRYKTELDLATDMFVSLSAMSGQQDKSLGDMRVMKQIQLPGIKSILDILEKRLAAWEIQLTGMRASPSGAIRAGSNTYPLNERNSF